VGPGAGLVALRKRKAPVAEVNGTRNKEFDCKNYSF